MPGIFSCAMNRNLLVSLVPVYKNVVRGRYIFQKTEVKYIYFTEDKQEHSFSGVKTFIVL